MVGGCLSDANDSSWRGATTTPTWAPSASTHSAAVPDDDDLRGGNDASAEGVVIDFGAAAGALVNTLTLTGITLAQLGAGDFLLA